MALGHELLSSSRRLEPAGDSAGVLCNVGGVHKQIMAIGVFGRYCPKTTFFLTVGSLWGLVSNNELSLVESLNKINKAYSHNSSSFRTEALWSLPMVE